MRPVLGCDMGGIAVHRAADRFLSRSPGVDTRHSLSFGPHYDPANTAFGSLVLHDEHRLEPGAGFPAHRHAGVEVVSWVLEGLLVHEHSGGGVHELGAGSLQHLSTGSGVVHAEHAAGVPTRFVQAWLVGERTTSPSYASTVPEPGPPAPVLEVGDAVLHAGRLLPGESSALGGGRWLHVFVAGGAVEVRGRLLNAGDALRSAGQALTLRAAEAAELLVWELQVTPPQE